jgi:hypothetical protein
MKAVIKGSSRNEIKYIIDYLLDYSIDSFIIFAKLDKRERYILENELLIWGIKGVVLKDEGSTFEELSLIKGSFTDTFLIVYSSDISKFDLVESSKYHKNASKICTLLSTSQKTVGIFLEVEIFDYMTLPKHFEWEVIKRTFEDDEASVYSTN